MVVETDGPSWLTTNGGASWTKVTLPPRFRQGNTLYLQFISASDGFLQTDTALWTTYDGGHQWTKVHSIKPAPYMIHFVSPSQGWMLSGSKAPSATSWTLEFTQDGGHTWKVVGAMPMEETMDLYFQTAQRGWIVQGHSVLVTRDGGKHWSRIKIAHADPMGVSAQGNAVYVIGAHGHLLKSTDGGTEWTTVIG